MGSWLCLPSVQLFRPDEFRKFKAGTTPLPIRAHLSLTTLMIGQRCACDLSLANEIQLWDFIIEDREKEADPLGFLNWKSKVPYLLGTRGGHT